MKSTARQIGAALAMGLVVLGTAQAGNVDWDNGDGANNYWGSPDNWNPNNVPGTGDNPRFFGGPKNVAITPAYTADLNGAMIDVGTGTVGFYKGGEGGFALIDSAGGGSLTCGVLHVQQGGRPAYEIRVPVTATTEIRTRYRLGGVKFYEELNTPEVDLGRGDGVYFYGDVNATTEFKLLRDDQRTTAYLMPNPEVAGSPTPTLTTPLVHLEDPSSTFNAAGIVDADTVEITAGGRYIVKHVSGLGDSTTNVIVSNGGYLQLDESPASMPSISVGPFAVLAGDLSGATYGSGGRISLVEDSVLAPTTGVVPTRAQLGGDAILYEGLTTGNKTVTVGDNEVDAIYKGAALGAFYGTGTVSGISVTAESGSGNLKVVYAGAGCPVTSNNNRFYGDGTSTTADVAVLNGALLRLTGALNSDYDYTGGSQPTRIDTFNISGEAGKERTTILDHYRTNGTHIKEGQTWNISKGTWNPGTYFAGRGQHGDVTVTDGIMQQAGTAYSASSDTGFSLTLAGRTVVETQKAANHGFLEELGANFSYSGMPVCTFTNGQNYAIDYSPAGANPILADLLMNSDLSSTTYLQVKFATDLRIGHERYLYNTLYRADDNDGVGTDTGAKIVPAGNQPIGDKAVMGFAAMGGQQNPIDMEVEAPGGIIRCGTTDSNRIMVANSGGFVTSIPNAAVWFRRAVTADELQIQSGTARFALDLNIPTIHIGSGAHLQLDSGVTATVTELLSGGGSFGGGNGIVVGSSGTVAPGDSPGTLTGTTLSLASGFTYDWEVLDPDGIPGVGWDLIDVDSLLFGGPWTLDAMDAGLISDVESLDVFEIARSDSTPAGFDAGMVTILATVGLDASGAYVYEEDNSIFLSGLITTVSSAGAVIPEPATLGLLMLAMLGLVARHK